MFILDTNVISELRHGKLNQSPRVRAWAAAQPSGRLFLSAISILELEKGILVLEHRVPPQGSALRVWLIGVRAAFSGGSYHLQRTQRRYARHYMSQIRVQNVTRSLQLRRSNTGLQ